MNCNEVVPLLSQFHDGELPAGQQRAVADHLASCSDCSQRLESLRRLSDLLEATPVSDTPDRLLERVERSLREPAPWWSRLRLGPQLQMALASLCAIAAVLTVGLLVWQLGPQKSHSHAEMVRVFGQFLNAYEQGEPTAIQVLPANYQGEIVSDAAASRALKRETVARPVVLANHEVNKRYLLNMPCCQCVETIYSHSGKTSFVLLEHEKEQPDWFDARPMIRTQCRGKACCMVQLKGSLGATWPIKGGFMTVVGVRDIEELWRLMDELQ